MAQHHFSPLLILLIAVLFIHCRQKESAGPADTVEIFALKNFEWQGDGICAVNIAKAEIASTPLVSNDDIVSYSKSDFMLEFKGEGSKNVKAIAPRQPFAVVVNGEVLFYGVCMQSVMSSVCFESITLENLIHGPNKAQLQMGYPGSIKPSSSLKDWRIDKKLLDALRKQGKLK